MGEPKVPDLRRACAAACVVVLAVLLSPPHARGDDVVQVTTSRSTFLPGDDEVGAPIILTRGVGITLTNTDAFAAHALTSDAIAPGGGRLFESGVLNFRASAPVAGVTSLPPGTYGFHCSVHEDNMHGHLVVL